MTMPAAPSAPTASASSAAPTRVLLALGLACAALLGGCAATRSAAPTLYDFGAAAPYELGAAAPHGAAPGALMVAEATGPAVLDSERMVYRLNYADPLQARAYATSRWSGTPLRMLTERLKTRIAQSGTKVLSPSDAAAGVAILRIDVDELSHNFDSTVASHGRLVLRASLFQGHALLDQKTFSGQVASASADAAGGARALAAASDAVAADIVAWLAAAPRKP